MKWNWEQPDWPRFSWSRERLAKAEEQFLVGGGAVLGATRHLDSESRARFVVEEMSEDAVTSSEIEGELLDREACSRRFGASSGSRRMPGVFLPPSTPKGKLLACLLDSVGVETAEVAALAVLPGESRDNALVRVPHPLYAEREVRKHGPRMAVTAEALAEEELETKQA